MKANIKHALRVSLVRPEGVWVVDVDHPPTGHLVFTDDEPQAMVWTLTGNAEGFSFVPLDDPKPGFDWKKNDPKKGIFGEPQICPSCGDLTIMNTHKKNTGSEGDFIYQLRIQRGLEIYETMYTLGKGKTRPVDDDAGPTPEDPCNLRKRVTTNPRIKNT